MELLKPRYKVLADYPLQNKEVGDIFETYENGINYIIDSEKFDVREYPHLFRRLYWWDERKVDEMPMYLKHTIDHVNWTYHKILKWDMNRMDGYTNIEKRQVCSLEMWSKEYSYLPITEQEYKDNL